MLMLAGVGPILISLGLVPTSLLLIGLILLQKNRGAGLSGALGGVGGHSAFGTKTGDFLTWVTVGLFAVFIILSVAGNYVFESSKKTTVAAAPAPTPMPITPTPVSPSGQPLRPPAGQPVRTIPIPAGGTGNQPIKITPKGVAGGTTPTPAPTPAPAPMTPAPAAPAPARAPTTQPAK
jgi:preprotein translocase subunit SecG